MIPLEQGNEVVTESSFFLNKTPQKYDLNVAYTEKHYKH